MRQDKVLIGTSGYDYPEWKGLFYPLDLKRKDFLSYYAAHFNALELNNTFYSMPTAERMLGFYERSQGQLSFSVKANRLLTHEVSPVWREDTKIFQNAVSPLLEKDCLATVLFQFPQSFHYTNENRIYLSKLIEEFKGFPLVVEFRHAEWIRKSVFDGLQERGAGIVYCDMPELKNLPPSVNKLSDALSDGTDLPAANGGLFYLRLHGRNAAAWYADSTAAGDADNASSRYTYDYSDTELQSFLPVIQNAVLTGKKPVVFFNNHPNGSGARNAKRLKDLLSI